MVDLKIETFLTVCKYMNFTRASEELHLSQSAVSQQIALLEDYYNTKLFTYNKRTLALTKAGLYLRNSMESLYNDSLKIKSVIENSLEYPPIRIGATLTIGNYYLPNIIIPYIRNNKANYTIHIDDTQLILEKIDEGKLDIALVEGIYNKLEYESRVFYTDSLVFVCNYDMNIEHIKTIEDTFAYSLLIRESGSGSRKLFENYLNEKGYDITAYENNIDINSIQIIKDFLYSNIGISVLYRSAIKDDLINKKLKIIPITNFQIDHPFTAIWKKNSIFDKEYKNIIDKLLINTSSK